MKVLKTIFVGLFILFLIVLVGVFIFIKTFDIKRYQSKITSVASEAIGRPVSFRDIDLDFSLDKGAELDVSGLQIGNENELQIDQLLRVEFVAINFDPFAYLTRKQIVISNIQIKSPQLTVVHRRDNEPGTQANPTKPSTEAAKTESSEPMKIPPIFIDTITVSDGEVNYIDKSKSSTVIQVTQLKGRINNFSLTDLFSVSFQGALFEAPKNFELEGSLGFDVTKNEITWKDLTMSTDLSRFPWEKLRALVPPRTPWPETLAGTIEITARDGTLGPQGLKNFLGDVNLENGAIKINDISPGISFAASQIMLKINNFSLTDPFQLSLQMAYLGNSPNISINGLGTMESENTGINLKNTDVKLDFSKMSLAQFKQSIAPLKDVPLPDSFAGLADLHVKDLSVNSKGLTSLNFDGEVREGNLSYKEITPGVSLSIPQLNLKLENFSLKNPFHFILRLAYLHALDSVEVEGVVLLNLPQQSLLLNNTKVAANLSVMSLPQLKASVASLKDVELPETVNGDLELNLQKMEINPQGIASLAGDLDLVKIAIQPKGMPADISRINGTIHLTESKMTFDDISGFIKEGKFNLKGTIDDYLHKQVMNVNLRAENIDIKNLNEQKDFPVNGFISGNFQAETRGFNLLLGNLKGAGQIEMKDGRLVNLNILQTVLNKISLIPNLAQKIHDNLTDQYKILLDNKDTIINQATLTASIDHGQITITALGIEAAEFLLYGKGEGNLDRSFNVDGALDIPEELTTSIVQSVPELRYLLNEDQQIHIPLKAFGKGDDVNFAVDLQYIGKRIIRNKGREELEKVLDKANQEKPAQQQAIEGILNNILK